MSIGSAAGSVARAAAARAAKTVVIRMASAMREGELDVRFPDNSRRVFGEQGAVPRASLTIADDEFFRRVVMHGEIGFGEAYMDDLWRSDDIVSLLELGIANRRHVTFNAAWLAKASRLRNIRLHRRRRNTRAGARDNIHAHYDLGNEFFRLFLDETLTYSCAYFSDPDEPLADAQFNKYRILCEQADLRPGDHVLEIGSGWGSFAIYAATTYGCRVTSITISREQLELAQQRVRDAGVESLVEIRFCDYREIEGTYDKIVSIEMFEAVGAEYFATFFAACDRALRPGGKIAMQTITVPDRSFESMRDGVNWMQKYIFPGGMLPSLAEIERALRSTSLVVGQARDIGPHYALTLRRWRERFMAALPEVRAQGFDERFIRMWEYYLAACEAGFLTRNTGDLQIVLEKPSHRTGISSAHDRQPATALA